MATRKYNQPDQYIYEYEYTKKDGTIGKITQKIPKKHAEKRELLDKYKKGNEYYYKYRTFYSNGDVKIVVMKRTYVPKKSKEKPQEQFKDEKDINVSTDYESVSEDENKNEKVKLK